MTVIDYRITRKEGFDHKIGAMISMLEHTRSVTMEEVSGISREELEYMDDPGGNTIASLLMHIEAIEFVHQIISFEERELTEEEADIWGKALNLGNPANLHYQGLEVDEYLEALQRIRSVTVSSFSQLSDQWLDEERRWGNGVSYNFYYIWYHVMEDEINHRGQMRLLRRKYRERSN